MTSHAVLRLASPGDCAEIGAFLEELGGPYYPERFPGRSAADLYRWKYFSSPYGNAVVGLAVADGKIVSLASAMPKRLQFGARLIHAYELGDFFTAESHRGQGLFGRLIEQIVVAAAGNGGELAYVRPNDISFPILVRRGFRELQQIDERRFPVPSVSLNKRFGGAGFVLRTLGADSLSRRLVLPRETELLGIQPVGRFPAEVDRLWQDAQPAWGVSMARTAEYLNWRFADSPAPFRLLLARRNGVPAATAVTFYSSRSRVGYIIDAFAAPQDRAAASAIVRHCFQELLEGGAQGISCWTVVHGAESALQAILRRACFRVQPPRLHVAFRSLSTTVDMDSLPNPPWHLCMGDFDGF